MDNIDPDGFYDHTKVSHHPDDEDRVWRMLAKRGLEDSVVSSMLGLTDSPETQVKLSTYSQRMHATLKHSDDHLPAERLRTLIDRLINEGWDIKSIAEASGASRATIGRVRKGGTWVKRVFVERLEAAA